MDAASMNQINDAEEITREPKRKRMEAAKERVGDFLNKLELYVEEAKPINAKINKEVVAVNRKHWAELKAIYKKRDEFMKSTENIWGTLICAHPQIADEYLVGPSEVQYLHDCLKSVDLEDFIDENGSYQITFTFGEEAASLFEPLVWTKKVILMDDCETVDEEKTEVTKITFKTDLNPIKGVEDMKKSIMEQLEGEAKDMDELPVYSVATWFSESKASVAGDFGEIFRRFLYSDPKAVMEKMMEEEESEEESQSEGEDEEACETSAGQTNQD